MRSSTDFEFWDSQQCSTKGACSQAVLPGDLPHSSDFGLGGSANRFDFYWPLAGIAIRASKLMPGYWANSVLNPQFPCSSFLCNRTFCHYTPCNPNMDYTFLRPSFLLIASAPAVLYFVVFYQRCHQKPN